MASDLKKSKTLEQLEAEAEKLHLLAQWKFTAQHLKVIKDGPPAAGTAYLWKWAVVRGMLDQACEVLPDSKTARRNFIFVNPGDQSGTPTPTITMSMQMVRPGEIAWAHRHSMNALRFVIEGSDSLYTVVDGEPLQMQTNDLVLTPAYTWHDHHNEGSQHSVWIDIIDAPLMGYLRNVFVEPYGESTQPPRQGAGDFLSSRGQPVHPAWERAQRERIPYRYPWSEVSRTLQSHSASEGSPYDGVILHYAHPITRGPTFPTMDCFVQLLRPGFETKKHRHTACSVYHVVEGEGTTIVGDQELNWSARDSFVVPNWTWHQHINRSRSSPAVLFSTTDAAMLAALGMYREEPETSFYVRPCPSVPGDLAYRGRQ